MKKSLIIFLTAGLLFLPASVIAAEYGTGDAGGKSPPVSQPLVREGDFAIKLAASLKLGSPADEAEAENLLAKAGVVPLNGWLSDYPVTPEILGQLQDAAAKAAADGKLSMTAGDASAGIAQLASRMNLPVPAGTEGQTGEVTNPPEAASSPTVVNNYYYDNGPPIVTYYPPPADYVYLYDWVPYPAWWFGFWFPGFFICHTFTTTIVVNAAPVIVTNRIFNPFTRTIVLVSPFIATGNGTVKPLTVLRTQGGRTFRTLADMKGEAGRGGTFVNRGFSSSAARKSAGAIYSGSVDRMKRDDVAAGRRERPQGTTGPSARTYRSYRPRTSGGYGEKRFIAPQSSGRMYNGPVARNYSGPSGNWRGGFTRTYNAPAAHSRSGSFMGWRSEQTGRMNR